MFNAPIRNRPAAVIQQPGYILTADGVSLFYRDWGAGKPLLFLPGWTLNSLMWAYQMEPLSTRVCADPRRAAHRL
jgi:pimeloyl-ACP methyl ester carboxylesterase